MNKNNIYLWILIVILSITLFIYLPRHEEELPEDTDIPNNEIIEEKLPAPAPVPAPIEYTVIDNEYILFKILKINKDSFDIYCKNNTDLNVVVAFDHFKVNDITLDPFWAGDLTPNEELTENISFVSYDFVQSNIENIEKMNFVFDVYEEQSFENIFSGEYEINLK